MIALTLTFQNVLDNHGIPIAIMGMSIVFFALVLISLFISLLPKFLEALADYLPPEGEGHGHTATPKLVAPDDGEIVAAIGFVLHQENRVP